MKRIFAIVFSVVFVFAAVVPAFAVSAATETETYTEYYGDGSYTVVTITATPVANAARAARQTERKRQIIMIRLINFSGVRRLEAFLHTTAQQQPAPAQQFLMRFIAANGNAIRRSPPRAATPQEVILNSISIRLL